MECSGSWIKLEWPRSWIELERSLLLKVWLLEIEWFGWGKLEKTLELFLALVEGELDLKHSRLTVKGF